MNHPTGPVANHDEQSPESKDTTRAQELAAVWQDLAQVCVDIQRRLALEQNDHEAEAA